MSTPPRPRLRAGDVVALIGGEEHVEGEIIAVMADGRYKVKWTIGLGYRDRVTTVTAGEIREKRLRP